MSFQHGGQLEKIKNNYTEQFLPWVDLSTGVSPFAYPVVDNSEGPSPWQCSAQSLPQYHDKLKDAAVSYYGTDKIAVIPGSMWGIQNIPLIRRLLFPNDARPVLLPRQGFNEHKKAWLAWGYDIAFYECKPTQAQLLSAQVCVVINPNNPTGQIYNPATLRAMLVTLNNGHGFLVIDEAFLDLAPELSMATEANKPNLIVLKSFGKFFGLPGLRLGALIAQPDLLSLTNKLLNEWSIPSMVQGVALRAWMDKRWQQTSKENITDSGNRLKSLLLKCAYATQGTNLFQTYYSDDAQSLYDFLLSKGIYTRLLDDESGLRFGLPKSDSEWSRLESALFEFKK